MAAKKQRYMIHRGGIWYFRIMVPKHLREKYGKPEINHSCGKDFDAAYRKAMAHALFYRDLFDKGEVPSDASRDDYTIDDVRETAAVNDVEFNTPEEVDAASVAEAVEKRSSTLLAYKRTKKVTKLEVMAFGGILPPMTMTQALKQYKEIKAEDCLNMTLREAQKKWNKFDEAVRFFETKMGKVDVWSLTRKQTMDYKNKLVEHVARGDFTSGTANSKIKWLRIILRDVFDVENPNHENPFDRIRVKSTGDEVKRLPFTEDDVQGIRAYLETSTVAEEVKAIMAIAENTACTVKEIVLLAPEDIVLEHELPHILIRPNEYRKRGAKTEYRHRAVPLVGRALEYAKKFPGGFPKYRRVNGSEALSAAANKTIKKVASEKTFYSFRHRVADLLRNSGIDDNTPMMNAIMGHEGGISSYYGTGIYLQRKHEALTKALPDYG